MRVVPGIVFALSLLVIAVWGQCAGCLSLAASHECCQRADRPDCHTPEPGPAQDCDCPDAVLILRAAKPQPALSLATPVPEFTAEAIAAPAPLPVSVFQRPCEPAARSGPPDLYLLHRVLLL